MTAQKVIVKAAEYNGFKDCLFMMKADDVRLTTLNRGRYEKLAEGKYSAKTKTFTANDGRVFTVMADWSVREL